MKREFLFHLASALLGATGYGMLRALRRVTSLIWALVALGLVLLAGAVVLAWLEVPR